MNNSEDKIHLKHPKVMGDFLGHVLPGSFFFIMAFWWSTKIILKYVLIQQKHSSHLISKAFFRQAEILEGIVIVGMASIGIIGLFFFSGKPQPFEEIHLVRILQWHHFTIYLFFIMLGVTKILCFTISSLPVSLTKLMISNVFFVEAFIFHNHTHGRAKLDIFGHQLLSFGIFLAGLVSFIDFLTKNNVVLELLQSGLTMLHGIWFWQIAFVLFPRSRDHAWDLSDDNNVMFLTIIFCLYYALVHVIIGANYAFVTWLVKWRLRKLYSSRTELLKISEQQEESEEEM